LIEEHKEKQLHRIPNCGQKGNVERCVESSTFDRVFYLYLDGDEFRVVKNTLMKLRCSYKKEPVLAKGAAVMLSRITLLCGARLAQTT
jgi:hypothetical protein